MIIDQLFQKILCTKLVKTKVGIKPINQIAKSDYFGDSIIKSVDDMKIFQLLAPPDFLKDKYTTLEKNIKCWPHYELIHCIDNDLSLNECDYVQRYRNGTLDFRKKSKISIADLLERYNEKLLLIEKGEMLPIKVYHVYDDKFFVADGKHTLAMAYYFKYENLRFDIIPNLLQDTYFRWVFEQIRYDKSYKRHNNLFKKSSEFYLNLDFDIYEMF